MKSDRRAEPLLPWDLRNDEKDDIARVLRAYEKQRRGERISARRQREVRQFLRYLERGQGTRLVVDYSREEGFVLRPRRTDVDTEGDIMRRPAGSPNA